MKILLLLLFILSTLSAIAQDSIPKKANTIIIHNVSFIDAANKLLDAGFIINKKDNDLQTIETEPKSGKKYYSVYVKYFFRIKDSVAVLYGTLVMSTGTLYHDNNTLFDRIYYGGMNNSPIKVSWNELNAFALSFNKPVEYLKE